MGGERLGPGERLGVPQSNKSLCAPPPPCSRLHVAGPALGELLGCGQRVEDGPLGISAWHLGSAAAAAGRKSPGQACWATSGPGGGHGLSG